MKSQSRLVKGAAIWLLLWIFKIYVCTLAAQGTAFTYQGRLNDAGAPANGAYDFRFRIASDPLGNNYVSSSYLTNGLAVSNGLFTTTLDFGPGIFTGSNYWLEVDVRTNGASSYTILDPLQALTPAPYAVMANSAINLLGSLPAAQLSGTVPLSQLPAAVLTNGENGVALTNLTLTGALDLPALVTINSGGSSLIRADSGENFFAGPYAGFSTTSGTYNLGEGYEALFSNTSGAGNTAIGAETLYANTTGAANVAVGLGTLQNNTIGSHNTAAGANALFSNVSGSYNTANGLQSLFNNISGSNNVANGYQALYGNTNGSDNTASGYQALYDNTNSYNTADGYQALCFNTHGSYNVAQGYQALYSNTSGAANAAVGPQALYSNTTGNGNTAIGIGTLQDNTSGSDNVGDGGNALFHNITGFDNTAEGLQALFNNTNGSFNAAEGIFALFNNTSGSNNIAVGYEAGYSITSGSSNIDIGNMGLASDANIIRIGMPGIQTNTVIAGVVDDSGGVRIGEMGTMMSVVQSGQAIMPPSGTVETNLVITFPQPFSSIPKILASAANDPAFTDVNDTFAVSVSSNSVSAFRVNVIRVDQSSGWSQQLRINWQAWQ